MTFFYFVFFSKIMIDKPLNLYNLWVGTRFIKEKKKLQRQYVSKRVILPNKSYYHISFVLITKIEKKCM